MNRRIVWVHGIGHHEAGYSQEWKSVYNPFLNLPDTDYIEVVWDPVFRTPRAQGGVLGAPGATGPELTPAEQREAQQVREELALLLEARNAATPPQPTSGAGGASSGVLGGAAGAQGEGVEVWTRASQPATPSGVLGGAPTSGVLGVSPFFFITDYIGDFVKYLVSDRVRTAVTNQFKQTVAPLLAGTDAVSIVSHSWGTVVAYDSLMDLETNDPVLPIVNLFTLGSPLWAVRRFLKNSSGHKPSQISRWVNVFAQGDPVGSWLRTGYEVDEERKVPTLGSDNHNSYFVANNTLVQRDIVAKYVLS
jgi:hypothetical protein